MQVPQIQEQIDSATTAEPVTAAEQTEFKESEQPKIASKSEPKITSKSAHSDLDALTIKVKNAWLVDLKHQNVVKFLGLSIVSYNLVNFSVK